MTVLACIVILLFIRLGLWQLHRAEEKKQILATDAEFATKSIISWDSDLTLPKQYQRIKVKGQFLKETILLDNQHYQHQFGYDVLSPLLLPSGKVVLIDRGWIAGELSRQQFPTPKIPNEVLEMMGSVYYPSEKSWVLGPALEKKEKVTLVERVDTELISQFLHKPVYPFIIRLDKTEHHGYVREWAIVAMPPARHYGYALQWFSMALVILILFISLNFKKLNHNGNT